MSEKEHITGTTIDELHERIGRFKSNSGRIEDAKYGILLGALELEKKASGQKWVWGVLPKNQIRSGSKVVLYKFEDGVWTGGTFSGRTLKKTSTGSSAEEMLSGLFEIQ